MALQGKNLFLTWPKCDKTKEHILEQAEKLWGTNLKTYLIAQEEHKDGTPHIHAYFSLTTRINYRKFDKIDALTGKRGNYQMCRSPKNVMAYCIKEDKNWLSNFDVVQKIAAMTSKKKYVGTEILLGKRKLTDLVNEDPSLLFDLPRWQRALDTYRAAVAEPRNHPMEVLIYWGESGTGKSKKAFEENPGAYWKTKGPWWQGYENQETVIIDEFYGWLEYDFILRLTDRYPMNVQIKGGHAVFNSKRIIFTSNKKWEEWWERAHDLEPLRRRISKVVHFTRPPRPTGASMSDSAR